MKIRIASAVFLTILCLALSAPAFADLYNNGPTNGTLNGFFIDGPGGPFGQTISDGFIAFNSGNASTLDFAEWVPTGTTPVGVSWMLGTTAFGNEISQGLNVPIDSFTLFGGTAFGYDVYISHVTGLSGPLIAGQTYYLTLGGANDSAGTQFDAWDVNEGVGAEGGVPATCFFAVGGVEQGGCPESESESFTINGTPGTTPEPSSIMLFGSGILGLATVLRRKMTR